MQPPSPRGSKKSSSRSTSSKSTPTKDLKDRHVRDHPRDRKKKSRDNYDVTDGSCDVTKVPPSHELAGCGFDK